MEQTLKTQIILAAVAAAGPAGDDAEAWNAQVAMKTAQITAMCSERSSLMQTIEQIERSKVFPATVRAITKEASSTRGVVTLETSPSQFHPDGTEQARTERTDSSAGLAMARRIRGLVGHRVMIWVEVEEINGGAGKVRVIRHIEDLGVAEAAVPSGPVAAAS